MTRRTLTPKDPPQTWTVSRETRIELTLRTLRRLLYWLARNVGRENSERRMALIPDDEIGKSIVIDGIYEGALLHALFDRVFADKAEEFKTEVAVDVGANIGNHSVFFSGRFKSVIAFEPSKATYHLLIANATLNNCTNVEIHRLGLSDSTGKGTLLQAQPNNIGTMQLRDHNGSGENVELDTGDSVLLNHPSKTRISLVKIDVEGHEPEVIRGMRATLEKYKPIILFEVSGLEIGESRAVQELRNCGYLFFYSLTRDLPFAQIKGAIARGLLRLSFGAQYKLHRRETLGGQYVNMAIASFTEVQFPSQVATRHA